MTIISRRRFVASTGVTFATAGAFAKHGLAQAAYPSRPIQLIIAAPPGHRTDIAGRILATHLGTALGQPVDAIIPEGGIPTALAAIASAPADGYTLGVLAVEIAIMHWRGLTPLTPADFSPIVLFAEDGAAIHVRADSPWLNAKQLFEHVRAHPGKVRVSSTPKGGIWHLSTVGLLASLGMSTETMPWIPSPNPLTAVEDMTMDGLDVVVCSVPEVRATPKAKQTRTLAVMARKRSPRFADVPTLKEATGSSYTSGNWRGLAGPKGLPPEITAALTLAMKKVWEAKDFQGLMDRRGFGLVWAHGRDFASHMEADDKRFGEAVKLAGMLTG
jgi:tripartite-type tricarboxylate transporter receptor subunit TctC